MGGFRDCSRDCCSLVREKVDLFSIAMIRLFCIHNCRLSTRSNNILAMVGSMRGGGPGRAGFMAGDGDGDGDNAIRGEKK